MNMFENLTNDFTLLLDILGFIQGIVLGIVLLILSKNKRKGTLFLGIFLILFSLRLLEYLSIKTEFIEEHPAFLLLPINSSWLLFAVFYIYSHKMSMFSYKKPKYWILYPGLFVFALQLFIYFQPYDTKLAILHSYWYEIIFIYSGIFYSWGIGVWNLLLIYRHRLETKNYYSQLKLKLLNWIGVFVMYSLISPVVVHILYYFSPVDTIYKVFFVLLDIIAIYYLWFYGSKQDIVAPPISSNETSASKEFSNKVDDNLPLQLDKNEMLVIMQRIDSYMQNSQSFVETDLTIVDVANALDIHPKRISTTTNRIRNQNFNSYVNGFRIKKAKELLKSKKFENLSVEGIGIEAGFHSKSSFYAAFKKVTSTTPTNYRNKMQEESMLF